MQQEQRESEVPVTEKGKLSAKIKKVRCYWNKISYFIPNVFRMIKALPNDDSNLFEFQDLSKKEVLIQSNGMKQKN